MNGNEPNLKGSSVQQKKTKLLKGRKTPGEGKFGKATLKHFVLLMIFMITCGVLVQFLHAPTSRVLYWKDGLCFSALKLNPPHSDSSSSGAPPTLFVFNDLGYPAESGKVLGNYFAGCGMTVFLFDYFAAPLTVDPMFRFIEYFKRFTSDLIQSAQINASTLYFMGFGLGATCALTLAESLPPRALITVNSISNFSRVVTQSGRSPRNTEEASQWTYWDIQLQNYGYTSFFTSLNESRKNDFIPTLHISRSQSNMTLLVRTTGDPACTAQDQEELRERLHCETWVMEGNGNNALLDEQLHANLAQWLQAQGLENFSPAQSITLWVDTAYVSATGFLVGIICIILVRYLKMNQEKPSRSGHQRDHMSVSEILSLLINAMGVIGLILSWGNLQALLWINGGIVGIQLGLYFIFWKTKKFQLGTWTFEEGKRPLKDLMVMVGIYGMLLFLSIVLFEPLYLPRGRNLLYLIVFCLEWGAFYLVNLAHAARMKSHRGTNNQEKLLGLGFRIFGTMVLLEEWVVLYNPLLIANFPFTVVFNAIFLVFIFNLPNLSPKLEFISLFLCLGLTCCCF